MVLSGPIAIRVIVSGGSVSRMRRISRWEAEEDGVKRWPAVDGLVWVVEAAVEVRRVPGGGGSKRCFQVSEGDEWWGC